jgi:WXXGXW repeat (2 copies)
MSRRAAEWSEMVVTASPARVAEILVGTLASALLLLGGAALVGSSASAMIAVPMVSAVAPTKVQPLLAQADDLAPLPSPDAIVTTPPPAALAENVPPPLPGYAWDPGRWAWDGSQYVWVPGKYIVQPTNGATFIPGSWQQYSGGWAWVDGRWRWGTQGEGE